MSVASSPAGGPQRSLGTSRTDPYEHGDGLASLLPALKATGIDSVVVIGGDGSLRTAARLGEEGLPVIGSSPRAIDNDIEGTDVSFGFEHRGPHRH